MPTSELQNQIAKLRRDKKFLWLGILFFVLVVLWILVSIFTTSRTSSIAPELRELAKPFVPRLESRVFEEILAKRAFTQSELSSFPIYIFDQDKLTADSVLIDITRVAPITEDEAATGSADKNATETATSSADATTPEVATDST